MRPQWVFLAEFGVVLLESAAFLVIGYLLCKRSKWARNLATVVGGASLCYRILTSTFPDRFYIQSPYLVVAGLVTPAGFLLLAAALNIRMGRSYQRILIAVFSVVLTYYAFCDVAYLAVKGPALASLTGRWEQEVMRQSRPFTCGPAAAASLLHAWGILVSEGDLAYGARCSFRGTELPRLADTIRFFGRYKSLKVKIVSTTFEELRKMNRPAVLLVQKGRKRHAVTLLRMSDGNLLIADPSNGPLEVEISHFNELYEWKGPAIVAWRDPDGARRPDELPDPSLHP